MAAEISEEFVMIEPFVVSIPVKVTACPKVRFLQRC